MQSPAIEVRDAVHHYGPRCALDHVSFDVAQGEVFALLGPNGGGKSTLFRLLATLTPPQQGAVCVLGCDLAAEPQRVRPALGVVFQSPSLDKKLAVSENLAYQARIYGLPRAERTARIAELLAQFDLSDRAGDAVETLSGGLRRRVELAKALLHRPRVLLLDEPSTGLDPGARHELWQRLQELRRNSGTTVLLTTHLLDEAEKADRVGILDRGRMVALDAPEALKRAVGGDVLEIEAETADDLAVALAGRADCETQMLDGVLRLRVTDGPGWAPRLFAEFPGRIRSLRITHPSLEDVFIARTGRRFALEEEAA